MKNKFKKIIATVAAIAVALTTVVVTDVTPASAAAKYDTLYASSDVEALAANEEKTYDFTVSKAGDLYFTVFVPEPVEYTMTMYNSAGVVATYDDNPLTVSATNAGWQYDEDLGYYFDDGPWDSLANGDYKYGIKFASDTQYLFMIQQEKASATISDSKATITAGFTKKLSVSGSKVKKWASSDKKIATVDNKGKVTAKKAGKATITATCENGQKVKCKVTVKANTYSGKKISLGDVYANNCAMSAYGASFDSKGNLVIKARFVNNTIYKVVSLTDIKITVKNANGKTVGTYSNKKMSKVVSSRGTADMSFTITKSSLKIKSVDLRNCTISCDGGYIYQY